MYSNDDKLLMNFALDCAEKVKHLVKKEDGEDVINLIRSHVNHNDVLYSDIIKRSSDIWEIHCNDEVNPLGLDKHSKWEPERKAHAIYAIGNISKVFQIPIEVIALATANACFYALGNKLIGNGGNNVDFPHHSLEKIKEYINNKGA